MTIFMIFLLLRVCRATRSIFTVPSKLRFQELVCIIIDY